MSPDKSILVSCDVFYVSCKDFIYLLSLCHKLEMLSNVALQVTSAEVLNDEIKAPGHHLSERGQRFLENKCCVLLCSATRYLAYAI